MPIFWDVSLDPSIVVLGKNPVLHASTFADDIIRAHPAIVSESEILRLQIRGERFDAAFNDDRGMLAAVVLLDELTPDRLNALARFWAALAGKSLAPDPRVTRTRQKRSKEMLRVVDGRASGATYRTIAEAVFPKHDHDAASWVGSAIRETTIRLARDGAALVQGGYRKLLRRPRRNR